MPKHDSDLWPQDVVSQTFQTPRQVLTNQASSLEKRMQGMVLAEVKLSTIDDEDDPRVVLRFEVFTASNDYRVKLFEVIHRRDFPYPALLVEPTELPNYLRRRYYAPSIAEAISFPSSLSGVLSKPGEWVENENVCATPQEFIAKLGEILSSPEIKSAVMAILARSQEEPAQNTT